MAGVKLAIDNARRKLRDWLPRSRLCELFGERSGREVGNSASSIPKNSTSTKARQSTCTSTLKRRGRKRRAIAIEWQLALIVC